MINLVAIGANSTYLSFDVIIEAYFDKDNHIAIENLNVKYKTNVSLMENCTLEFANYDFKYWLINNHIVSEKSNYKFEVIKDTKATAIYKPADKIVVVFVDDNNYVLKVDYYNNGDILEEKDYYDERLLNKVGYRFNGWYVDGEELNVKTLTSDIIIKATYKMLDKRNPYRLVVFDGKIPSGQNYYPFGQLVTIIANDDPVNKEFLYWVDDVGNIASPSRKFKFTIIKDIKLTAIYGDIGTRVEEPFININVVTSVIEAKKISYVNQFYFPNNISYKFIEAGMLMIRTTESIDKSLLELDANFRTKDVRVLRAHANSVSPSNEFVMSKVNVEVDDIWYARSYIIYEEMSVIKIKYSFVMTKVKEVIGGKEIL